MAVKTLEEIQAQLTADERKLFDNLLAKEPELKDGWLRRDDYTRKTQELATERKAMETKLEYAERMKAWAEENVPRYDSLIEKGIISDDGEELWSAQKAELEAQLKAARDAAVGGDMDPAELDKRVRAIVKESGMALTQQEINNLYANEGKKMAQEVFDQNWKTKEEDFNTKTIPFVGGFSAGTAIVAIHYEKESGKSWTEENTKELYALMSKEQEFNPYKIEEKFLAPLRAKKDEDARFEAEVEKRLAARGLPGDGTEGRYIPGPGSPKGALQQALDSKTTELDFESRIKAAAVEGAQELIAEGKV
jgi:hypothetical protein